MKKTVQIVTVPLNKEGWGKDDLLITDNNMFETVPLNLSEFTLTRAKDWQAQQLLVLSDDEIQGGDWVMAFNPRGELGGGYRYVTKIIDKNYFEDDGKISGLSSSTHCHIRFYKKVIASYPQLEGTLSISKETVQAWIDSGTPEEGSIETENICLQTSISCGYPCNGDCDEKAYKEYVYNPQGNLLLEFGKKEEYSKCCNAPIHLNFPCTLLCTKCGNSINSDYTTPSVTINKTRNVGTSFDSNKKLIPFNEQEPEIGRYISLVWEDGSDCECTYDGLNKSILPLPTHWYYVDTKPSIPTDEEIKKKAVKNSSSYRAKAAAIISYTEGYKQALKDLGHE